MNLPTTMKAAISERYGEPEVIRIGQIPLPSVKNDEVLVKVHYCTVNRTDCGFLTATPFIVRAFAGLRVPKFSVLGCEYAGEIVAKGAEVSEYNIGDRVFGFKDDDFGFGGHAEYTTASLTSMLAPIPKHLSYREAAAGLEGSHYALHYIRSIGATSGQRILVNGGTGAIGSAAVQMLTAIGVDVTAVCATPNIEQVQALGAKTVVDYLKEDFTQLDEKFDAVFDAVGKSTFGRCRAILKEQGIYVSTEFGPMLQNPFLALIPRAIMKQQVHFPIPSNKTSDAIYIQELMQQGQYLPLIDKEYTLDNIIDAYQYVLSEKKIGNVLVKVAD